MGNRIKTGVAYVVKLLPIAIELIKKYGTDIHIYTGKS